MKRLFIIGVLLTSSACVESEPAKVGDELHSMLLRDVTGRCIELFTDISVMGTQFAQFGSLHAVLRDSARCAK